MNLGIFFVARSLDFFEMESGSTVYKVELDYDGARPPVYAAADRQVYAEQTRGGALPRTKVARPGSLSGNSESS